MKRSNAHTRLVRKLYLPVTTAVAYCVQRLSIHKTQKQINIFRPDHNGEKIFRNHPLKMGGLIGEGKDINSIKLGLAGSHISQTNHGYSRKEDGTFYNY
ncbi:Hypothetical protein CINCED_3A023278 [Cinara cedri]|uniref:Uncharacterized protein n=1 Tax=Cinara cedri TaxID=506608 RepID=A0A5E4MZV9_9HEMI|nr:Hypothetical protein CINCED_3A023278 [Cinara cedri]